MIAIERDAKVKVANCRLRYRLEWSIAEVLQYPLFRISIPPRIPPAV